MAVTYAVGSAAFGLAVWLLPGSEMRSATAAFVGFGVITLLNAIAWPFIARVLTPVLVFTVGLADLAVNGLIIMFAARLVPGFVVDSWGDAVVLSIVLTFTTMLLNSLFAIDDDDVWRRNTMRRYVKDVGDVDTTDRPGVLFIQIDGLGHEVFVRALQDGYMPTLAGWIRSGSHRLIEWECDLSSQTGASQAGILHGNNSDMPAFRWYDKEAKHVYTTNRPNDAEHIEADHSDGKGLLVDGGVSRSNVFSGDSPDSMMTFSTVLQGDRTFKGGLAGFFSDPYGMTRIIVLSIGDIGRELVARRRARVRKTEPRLKRGGIYPVLRAGATTALRDLTMNTLITDVLRGVPSAYVDFVGYDEVAHHSGISAYDALETLYRLDQQFARLERTIEHAPRPYELVVLSDHGQSQGATFKQRYGKSLGDVVHSLAANPINVDEPALPTEGWGNVNGALTSSVHSSGRLSAVAKRALRKKTVNGEVRLGQDRHTKQQIEQAEAVVLASGNLGLVSFPDMPGRATVEEINEAYPGLVDGVTQHPGVGWVLVDSAEHGGLVLGHDGVRYLDDGRVEGTDPLAGFGDNAVHHVKRTHGFSNTPDLLINSFYDPQLSEGAAFEELIGFHGGMGGPQSRPFILAPAEWKVPDEPIVGAASVHYLFKDWLAAAGAGPLGG